MAADTMRNNEKKKKEKVKYYILRVLSLTSTSVALYIMSTTPAGTDYLFISFTAIDIYPRECERNVAWHHI